MINLKNKIVLIGGGGYCSGVLDSLKSNENFEIIGITDPNLKVGDYMNDIPILGDDSILEDLYRSGICYAHVTVGSVGNCNLRKKLIKIAEDIGFELISIIDPSAVISNYVKIGKMVYVGKNAVINSNVKIGDYCIINTSSIVEHGCVLGNYVHVAPGATLAGDIHIGDETHLGLNCSILQGLKIENNVIVGAGSTVLRNVKANRTVVGIVK